MKKEDMFLIMEKVKYLYPNGHLQREINEILEIYQNFITKKVRLPIDLAYEAEVHRKLINNIDGILVTYVLHESLMARDREEDFSPVSAREREGRELICLRILYDLSKYYPNQYSQEIYKCCKFLIGKSENHMDFFPKMFLFQLVEIIFNLAIQSPPKHLSDYIKTVERFLRNEEIVNRLLESIKAKVQTFMIDNTNEALLEAMSYMEVHSGDTVYPMKIEYLPQLFLQQYCELCKEANIDDYKLFEHEGNTKKLIWVRFKQGKTYNDFKAVLHESERIFNDWFNAIVICYKAELKDKHIFMLVCKGFAYIIDMLINPEEYILIENLERSKHAPKFKYPMPTETFYQIFDYFFWKTLNIDEPEKFEARHWSIRAYMNIFCHTQSEINLNKAVITDAIKFLYSNLKTDYKRGEEHASFIVNCVLIKSTEDMFLTDYPILKCLIPTYLKVIENLFILDDFGKIPLEEKHKMKRILIYNEKHTEMPKTSKLVKNSALKILKSLLFSGYTLGDMVALSLSGEKFKLHLIRERIIFITYKILGIFKRLRLLNPNNFANTEYCDIEFQHNLYTIAMNVMFLECQFIKQKKTIKCEVSIEDYIDIFFQTFGLDIKEMDINLFSLHAQIFGRFAGLINTGMRHYTRIFHLAIIHLTSKIKLLLKGSVNSQKKEIISDLLHVLLVILWIINDTRGVLLDKRNLNPIIEMVTESTKIVEYRDIIEIFIKTMMMYYLNFPLKSQEKDTIDSIFEEVSFKNLQRNYNDNFQRRKASSMFSRRIASQPSNLDKLETIGHPTLEKSNSNAQREGIGIEQLLLLGSDGEKTLKRTRLLDPFQYLPFQKDEMMQLLIMRERELIDYINMQIRRYTPDKLPEGVMYLCYQDSALLVNVGESSRTIGGRILMRNITGRFGWEFSYLSTLNSNVHQRGPKRFDELPYNQLTIIPYSPYEEDMLVPSRKGSSKKNTSIPKTFPTDIGGKDILKEWTEFLVQLIPTFKQFEPEDDSWENKKRTMSKEVFDDIYDNGKAFWEKRQKNTQKSFSEDLLRRKDVHEITHNKYTFDLNTNVVKLDKLDGTRLLYSNLGFIDAFSDESDACLCEADHQKHMLTTVSLLDIVPPRETVKVGVIYAARGQENQKEILKNTKGSFAYESFIQGLGEVVDLKSHLGFQAGLKHKTDGEHAIYYSDPLIEVMFHVATMMPTSEEDEQVLNKKRHVGNDHVNIIWCENYRAYRRNTISSQYNFIQIVIYPLKYDLFKVSVLRKEGVPYVLPWIDNMVISKEYLALYVRLTAENSFRKCRPQKESTFQSYQKRNEYLKQFYSQSNGNSTNHFKRKGHITDVFKAFLHEASPNKENKSP